MGATEYIKYVIEEPKNLHIQKVLCLVHETWDFENPIKYPMNFI